MRSTSPRQLALFVAFIISVLAVFIFWLLSGNDLSRSVGQVAIGFILLFILSFVSVYYTLKSFIFEKINPIYKTIRSIPMTEEEIRKSLEGKDIIGEVNHQVKDYAQKKAREIKKLKRLEKYRKEFLGNVSHELKTPIFNIQGYILTLLDGALEDPSINREYLERTEKSINRLISIVQDLESISRLESGEMQLNLTDFDAVHLVRDVYDMQEMRAKRNGIALQFDRSYDKPVMVHADRGRMFEVLNNLVVNSIIYGNEGGQTTVSFSDMGENVLIEVADNGIGIEEREITRIFERFYRTDKSRSRDQGGTGLGLSIVKHIIEAHNQSIAVRSTPGKSSTFALTLKKA